MPTLEQQLLVDRNMSNPGDSMSPSMAIVLFWYLLIDKFSYKDGKYSVKY